jgi:hypothetical protein
MAKSPFYAFGVGDSVDQSACCRLYVSHVTVLGWRRVKPLTSKTFHSLKSLPKGKLLCFVIFVLFTNWCSNRIALLEAELAQTRHQLTQAEEIVRWLSQHIHLPIPPQPGRRDGQYRAIDTLDCRGKPFKERVDIINKGLISWGYMWSMMFGSFTADQCVVQPYLSPSCYHSMGSTFPRGTSYSYLQPA